MKEYFKKLNSEDARLRFAIRSRMTITVKNNFKGNHDSDLVQYFRQVINMRLISDVGSSDCTGTWKLLFSWCPSQTYMSVMFLCLKYIIYIFTPEKLLLLERNMFTEDYSVTSYLSSFKDHLFSLVSTTLKIVIFCFWNKLFSRYCRCYSRYSRYDFS